MAEALQQRLNIEHRTLDPATIELVTVNARFMTHDQFARLVENIRRDGALTSSPLLYWPATRERPLCLSGNHRTRAAVAVGLSAVDALVITTELTASQQTAIQLAHNAVEGQDDPSTLRALFDSIEAVDERLYSGLDDAELDLLADFDLPSINELSPRWHTLTFLLLDDEAADLAAVFDEAVNSAGQADDYWLARLASWDALLAHLQTVRSATNIVNRAVGLRVICETFRRHVSDLGAELDLTSDSDSDTVPLAAICGYDVPARTARLLDQAIARARQDEAVTELSQALEAVAAGFLATQPDSSR